MSPDALSALTGQALRAGLRGVSSNTEQGRQYRLEIHMMLQLRSRATLAAVHRRLPQTILDPHRTAASLQPPRARSWRLGTTP